MGRIFDVKNHTRLSVVDHDGKVVGKASKFAPYRIEFDDFAKEGMANVYGYVVGDRGDFLKEMGGHVVELRRMWVKVTETEKKAETVHVD